MAYIIAGTITHYIKSNPGGRRKMMAYNNNDKKNDRVEFKIERKLGVLQTYQTGWTKEVNMVSWNGGDAKIDIRDWNPDHDRMSRGVTLYEEEGRKLAEALKKCFEEAA